MKNVDIIAALAIIAALLLPKWAIIAVAVVLVGWFGYHWWRGRKK